MKKITSLILITILLMTILLIPSAYAVSVDDVIRSDYDGDDIFPSYIVEKNETFNIVLIKNYEGSQAMIPTLPNQAEFVGSIVAFRVNANMNTITLRKQQNDVGITSGQLIGQYTIDQSEFDLVVRIQYPSTSTITVNNPVIITIFKVTTSYSETLRTFQWNGTGSAYPSFYMYFENIEDTEQPIDDDQDEDIVQTRFDELLEWISLHPYESAAVGLVAFVVLLISLSLIFGDKKKNIKYRKK